MSAPTTTWCQKIGDGLRPAGNLKLRHGTAFSGEILMFLSQPRVFMNFSDVCMMRRKLGDCQLRRTVLAGVVQI